MFKYIKDRMRNFDIKWIPVPAAGRFLCKRSTNIPDSEAMEHIWKQGRADEQYYFAHI